MLDLVLFILLGLVQIVFAAWGGIVSAESLPAGLNKRKHIAGFIALGVIGLILTCSIGIINFKEGRQAEKDREDAHHTEESINATLANVRHDSEISAIQQQDMRERFGDLEKVLAILGRSGNDSANKAAEAVKAFADSQLKAQTLSNDELSKHAIAFANRLRKFQFDIEQQQSQMSYTARPEGLTKEQQDAYYRNRQQLTVQLDAQRNYEFRAGFVGEAVYLRDEMLNRLVARGEKDIEPTPGVSGASVTKQELALVFGGFMAGNPIPIMADYMEKLARKLSPSK
jgi:hypothetical protein